MEDIVKYILTNAPNLIGFAVLSYILWRMNERLMTAVLDRLDKLEDKVQAIIVDHLSNP